jgi:hypothetical protein
MLTGIGSNGGKRDGLEQLKGQELIAMVLS